MSSSTNSLVLLGFSLLASVCWGEANAPTDISVKMTHLDLTADRNYEDGSLDGVARMKIENASDRDAVSVPFNLNRLMSFSDIFDEKGRTLDYVQDVSTFVDEPKKQVTHAIVSLAEPLRPGHSTELDRALLWEANYAGTSFATLDKWKSKEFKYGSDNVQLVADEAQNYDNNNSDQNNNQCIVDKARSSFFRYK